MRKWAIPAAAIALPLYLCAELPPIQSFTAADGLAGDHINKIVADSHGFIWFCTSEGLSRFDGHRIVSFGLADGLPHRDVNALLETRSGEYLVGTAAGLCQFQPGRGGQFTTYRPGYNRRQNYVTALVQDAAGKIWCGTNGGLFEVLSGHRFRPQALSAPPPGQDRIMVNDLAEDAGHRLWVATHSGIDVVGPDGSLQHILIGGWTENVRALLPDGHGGMWAATQNGLALLRGSRVQRVYREIGGVKQLDLTSLAEGPDGALWAGASTGIFQSLPGVLPATFRILTRAQGLIDRQVNALTTDRAGNIWAGTEGAGVMKIQTNGFTTFRENDGLATDRVWSLVTDRAGSLLAVTADAPPHHTVNLFDGTRFHAWPVKVFSDHPSWGHRILLQARNGAWWAATSAGLCMFAPSRATGLANREPQVCYAREAAIYQIFEDAQGRIWASAQLRNASRLLRWDPAPQSISWMDGGPGSKELVDAFAEDHSGNIWLALGSGDLLRYQGRRFTRFGQNDGVPPGAIRDLFVDSRSRLWVGSADGLGRVDDPANPQLRMRIYKASDGLASDSAGPIVEDKAGRVYVCTARGMDRLDPQTGSILHFSTANGLAHGEITAAIRDRAGDLWFATTQGLTRLSPAAEHSPAIPTVRIVDLHIGHRGYPVSAAGETRIALGELQPFQNQLQVAFVGFSDEPESNLRYTYTLEGGDSTWQTPARDHEVNYEELAPGRYRFLVKAVNSQGPASTMPAEVDFVVLPPIWKRGWFGAVVAAAAGTLAFVAYRRRLEGMTTRVRLLYEERLDERTRIARELHDTLLQSLAGVSLHLDAIAKQMEHNVTPAAAQIRAVRQQVDASFLEARQKVQDLRSPTLTGRSLPAVLRDSLEHIASGHPVQLRTTVNGKVRRLPEETDEAVLRIAQEAVANAVRHAQANQIAVSLDYERRALRLRVQDDGRGFDAGEAGRRVGHWGLRNMQERAHRIGAEWKLTTGAHGTAIETTVPLPEDQ